MQVIHDDAEARALQATHVGARGVRLGAALQVDLLGDQDRLGARGMDGRHSVQRRVNPHGSGKAEAPGVGEGRRGERAADQRLHLGYQRLAVGRAQGGVGHLHGHRRNPAFGRRRGCALLRPGNGGQADQRQGRQGGERKSGKGEAGFRHSGSGRLPWRRRVVAHAPRSVEAFVDGSGRSTPRIGRDRRTGAPLRPARPGVALATAWSRRPARPSPRSARARRSLPMSWR